MILTSRRLAEYRQTPWKNGLGVTAEIARSPADGADFLWRVSMADVATDGPFSIFPGIDRSLTILVGSGLDLDFGAHGRRIIDQPFVTCDFPGDWPAACRLLDGPVRDLNVMTRRGSVWADRYILHAPAAHLSGGVSTLVFALNASVALSLAGRSSVELDRWDSLLIDWHEGDDRQITIAGDGIAYVAEFGTAPPGP